METKIHLIENENGINFSVQKSKGYYKEDGKIIMCAPSIVFLIEKEETDTVIIISKEESIRLSKILLELAK